MTLDESIKHAEEIAEEKEAKVWFDDGNEKTGNSCVACAEEHRQLAEWLKDYKRLKEQEPRWIPVSERLPEEFESVLVCYKSQGGMAQAVSERFGTHTGYRWSALMGIEPIAWMPLPQPYTESEVQDADSN